MPRIFLSYRQSETQEIARRLCARLREQYGPQVFLNVGQIPLGSDFRDIIAQEVEQSDLVLVLIGPGWLETVRDRAPQAHDFVRTEIEMALAKNVLTVPILIGEETEMPGEEELPPRIARLAYLQGFRLQPEEPFEGQMKRLIAGLNQALFLREIPGSRAGTGGVAAGLPPEFGGAVRKRRVACAGLDLLWVEPGSFWMGSPEDEPGRWPDEGPRHLVGIPQGFWLGATPVTQAQFSRVMEFNPSSFPEAGEQAPVESVTWREARTFCLRLQRMEPAPGGLEYRLPFEAEWEYACRAGTTGDFMRNPSPLRALLQRISRVLGQVFARLRSSFVMFCHAEAEWPALRAVPS